MIEKHITAHGNVFCFDHVSQVARYESPKGNFLRDVENPKRELRFARRWKQLLPEFSTNRKWAIWREQNIISNLSAVESTLHPDLVAAIHGAMAGTHQKDGLIFKESKYCSIQFFVDGHRNHWLDRIPTKGEKTYGNAFESQNLWASDGNGWIDVYISNGKVVGLSGTVKWQESFGQGYVVTVSYGYLSEQPRVSEAWVYDRKQGKNW